MLTLGGGLARFKVPQGSSAMTSRHRGPKMASVESITTRTFAEEPS